MTVDDSSAAPLRFICDWPFISQQKLAILKVVAKYTVLDPQVVESRRSDFDFLDPKHDLHSVYQKYVNQYQLVNDGAKPSEGNVLVRAIARAKSISTEPAAPVEKPVAESESAGLVDHIDSAASVDASKSVDPAELAGPINWNHFVVLETVEFFASDVNGSSNLSAPLTIQDMQLQRHTSTPSREPLFKSPITGELVPASKFNDHIKIHSIAPQYHQQKRKETERQSSTNLDIARAAENLELLRQKRRRMLEEEDYL